MTRAKRILHVFGAMNRGGAETMIMNVYRRLDRSEIQFDFAVQTSKACAYDEEIRALGGRILAHPAPAEAGISAYRRAFTRTLREHGPFSAVHSHIHLFSGVVLSLCRRQGVPVRISHSHNTSDGRRPTFPRRLYGRYMNYLIRRNATHLLGCSRQACEALFGADCWSDRRVGTVKNAVQVDEFAGAAAPGRLRRELGISSCTPLVGQVASFSAAKNHLFAIDVFRALRLRRPGARLALAGDGPLRPQIEARVRELGLSNSVHLLGVRNDIPRILGELDLVLMPSLWEGLPVTLVEAQAAGVPCLVSDNVTREVDLNVGLIRFASLDAGADAWADWCVAQMGAMRPEFDERSAALRLAGYDLGSTATQLAGIYRNEERA